jgi:hypothetical protein
MSKPPTSSNASTPFAQRVAESGVVWGLYSEELGWANSESRRDPKTDVILFWSDRALAAAHQQEEWARHVPTEIELDEFIDGWLQGMDQDGVLAGPDWDVALNGREFTARQIADQLLAEKDTE